MDSQEPTSCYLLSQSYFNINIFFIIKKEIQEMQIKVISPSIIHYSGSIIMLSDHYDVSLANLLFKFYSLQRMKMKVVYFSNNIIVKKLIAVEVKTKQNTQSS